jgi:hypothetical protein
MTGLSVDKIISSGRLVPTTNQAKQAKSILNRSFDTPKFLVDTATFVAADAYPHSISRFLPEDLIFTKPFALKPCNWNQACLAAITRVKQPFQPNTFVPATGKATISRRRLINTSDTLCGNINESQIIIFLGDNGHNQCRLKINISLEALFCTE